MRSILFVQNGDYREAYLRFAQGGAETYRDQKRSVDFVANLAKGAKVTTFAFCPDTYHSELAPNLWAAGAPRETVDDRRIAQLLNETGATHLVLRTPHRGFLRAAARRDIYVLPWLADIFNPGGFRTAYRNWRLRRALDRVRPPCVSNHSLNASRSLVEVLGIPAEKVVPWDRSKLPLAGDAKTGVADPARPTAFFAGVLSENKGVEDCLAAVALLRADGLAMSITFAGGGDAERWRAEARKRGIEDAVRFLGTIPNAQVRTEMRKHDFVIVPSRHSYPEGLPNTICEGLVSRSAVVISDHPAFGGRLIPDSDTLVFPAANPEALAACLRRGVQDPALYRRLSENAPAAHDKLYIGMEWTDLVTAFLDDPEDRTGWVRANSLKRIFTNQVE